jgi:cholesterol transport system auxiliary component
MGGCSSKEIAPLKIYTLQAEKISPFSTSSHRHQTIKVSFPQTLKEKISNKINYSYSANDQGVYLHSQWSNNSGKLIQGSIIQTLDSSKLFKAVLPYESTAGEELRLESNIYDFSHHVRGDASYAIVSIQFSLIDTDTGKLMRTKRFSYKEETKTTDAKGYVTATQKIMHRLSVDLVKWLR